MKYIRTKNAIYDNSTIEKIIGREIIEQEKTFEADTIEELVDAIIGIYDGEYQFLWSFPYKCSHYWDVVYGAIWTNKGLMYVAKLNDKGELKLI